MKTIKIVRLTKKEGESTKDGKKFRYVRMGIYDGERWYSCFENAETRNWKEGDTITGNIVEREYQGKIYYDIKPESQLDRIESKLDIVIRHLTAIKVKSDLGGSGNDVLTAPPDAGEPPPSDDDIPF